MSTNLMTAHHEWATRPPDQVIKDVPALLERLLRRKQKSREHIRPFDGLRTIATKDGNIMLTSMGGTGVDDDRRGAAALTHHSFDQLASKAGFSGDFFRTPLNNPIYSAEMRAEWAEWVSDGLNRGLKGKVLSINASKRACKNARILFQMRDRSLGQELDVLRAINTERFTSNESMSDLSICQKFLVPLYEHGFINPPARDPRGEKPGVHPAGLYLSDRDMFALLAPKNVTRINMPSGWDMPKDIDGGFGGFDINGRQFYPFVIVRHCEVGGESVEITSGLLDAICSNLILWNCLDVTTITVRHVGEEAGLKLDDYFFDFMRSWITAGTLAERKMIEAAMEFHVIGEKSKEDKGERLGLAGKTVTWLTKQGWSKKQAEKTVSDVEMHGEMVKKGTPIGTVSDDPTVLWNLVAAITAESRTLEYQDQKLQREHKAAKLLDLVGAN